MYPREAEIAVSRLVATYGEVVEIGQWGRVAIVDYNVDWHLSFEAGDVTVGEVSTQFVHLNATFTINSCGCIDMLSKHKGRIFVLSSITANHRSYM